jgi:hypothetical protein
MSYYCDYNWTPLVLSPKFCCDSERWELLFESTLNFSGRKVCCASEDFSVVMTFDINKNTYFIENHSDDGVKDIFKSNEQIKAETFFLTNNIRIFYQ